MTEFAEFSRRVEQLLVEHVYDDGAKHLDDLLLLKVIQLNQTSPFWY